MWYEHQGMAVPALGDELLPQYITASSSSLSTLHSSLLAVLFVLGIVAASFSSADSALTSLTTIYCMDIRRRAADEQLRKRTHLLMCVLFVFFVLLFRAINSTSLIDAIYTIVSYTYGPLLGLFAFGLLTHRPVADRWVPYIAVAAPVTCYAVDAVVGQLTDYRFGYELLMLNGLLTFCGLWITAPSRNA
jgi:Na+/proline symporter